MKKETQSVIKLLPRDLVTAVDNLGLSDNQRDKCMFLIDRMTVKSYREGGTFTAPLQLSSNYFRKVFNSKYQQFFKPMLEGGIIKTLLSSEGTASYRPGKYAKSYYLNPSFFYLENNQTYTPPPLPIFVTTPGKRPYPAMPLDEKQRECILNLKFDTDRMEKEVDELCEKIGRSDLLFGDKIEHFSYEVRITKNNNPRTIRCNLERAAEIAEEDGLELFQDKGVVHIANVEDHLRKKKATFNLTAHTSIAQLESSNVYCYRSNVNGRVSHNITNMHNSITSIIIEDNDLVQLDLCNSQMKLLASLLPDNLVDESTIRFKELASRGELYNALGELCEQGDRGKGKNLAFVVAFGSPGSTTPGYSNMKESFPEVVAWAEDFKSKESKRDFAILLQKKESDLFIDGLFAKLVKKDYFCITKHDSLIVKRSELDAVLSILEEEFRRANFECTMVIDYAKEQKKERVHFGPKETRV